MIPGWKINCESFWTLREYITHEGNVPVMNIMKVRKVKPRFMNFSCRERELNVNLAIEFVFCTCKWTTTVEAVVISNRSKKV